MLVGATCTPNKTARVRHRWPAEWLECHLHPPHPLHSSPPLTPSITSSTCRTPQGNQVLPSQRLDSRILSFLRFLIIRFRIPSSSYVTSETRAAVSWCSDAAAYSGHRSPFLRCCFVTNLFRFRCLTYIVLIYRLLIQRAQNSP